MPDSLQSGDRGQARHHVDRDREQVKTGVQFAIGENQAG